MSGYDSLRDRTPKETLLEGFVKRMKKQNEEGRYRGSRIDHSNFISNDSQDPSGEDTFGEMTEKIVTKIQLAPVNPLNKLYCSLMSGLRNEIDFGLRVSTILANSKESSWISDFKFIDILIDCVESYSCCCDEENSDSIKQIDNGRVYCNINVKHDDLNNPPQPCTCLKRFWSGLFMDKQVMNLVFGSSSSNGEDADAESSMIIDEDSLDSEDLAYLMDTKKHEPKNHERIYNLIKNITEIIRNLSFNISESTIPSVSDESSASGYSYNFATLNLLKFLVLLISCKDQYYQNMGLDIISNISSHFAINSVNSQYLTFLDLINRYCINTILYSNDIHQINRSLEIISKIISRYSDDPNEYIAIQLLDQELLQRLTELLTCQHDVNIVISSLELLFTLSESYSKLLVEENKYLIKILVMLLNCEASSFFTKSALARIKIVDERPKSIELVKTPNQKATTTTAFATPATENETYVVTWLRTCFEAKPNPGTLLRLNEIYEDYVKECIRCDRKNVITAHNFAILTKRCFPSITMTGPIIDGLIRRPVTITTTTTKGPGGLSSPILKAQLCAPPKAGSLSPGPGVVSTPPNTSTLIKNLLANKLRTNSSIGTPPSSTTISSFSSISTGSVTVTPASASSPSSSNKDNGNGSKSDTTTTIIPCTINNLNSTFTQLQKPQEPYPDPSDLTPSANKTAFSNSSQSHKSKETNSLTSSITTSVITSNTPVNVSSSSSSSTTFTSSSSSTPMNNIFVTSTNNNNNSSSLSTSVTITPAITNNATPLIPAITAGGSVNTQQVIVTGNPTSTANLLQPQTTCISTGQALQGGSVLFTTPAQPGQSLQPNQPQQFLLVRTIVGNQQQTGLVGMPAGVASGTPVRLILPPGFLTQQRPIQQSNTAINGVTTVPVAITSSQSDSFNRNAIQTVFTNSTKVPLTVSTSQTFVTSQPISSVTTTSNSSTTPQPANSNSNDILLKAVLGSGIVSENSPSSTNSPANATSNRSNTVKSSPLLNVLLDKGKLPDFSAMAGTINQSNVTNSCVTTITSVTTSSSTTPFNNPPILNTVSTSSPITHMSASQSNKLYILTTKSSLPIKNVATVQQSQLQQQLGGQVNSTTVATNNLQKSITVQQMNPTTVQQVSTTNLIQQVPTTKAINSSEVNLNSSTSVSVATPTLNKLVSLITESSPSKSTQSTSTVTTVKPIQLDSLESKPTLISIKNELSNGEVTVNSIPDVKSSTIVSNEIVTINDVNKVSIESSASKMISKRSYEEDDSKSQPNKKMKSNNTINSLSITPLKKEIKIEPQQSTNKIKTNGTSVIPSSNGKQELSSSSSSSSSQLNTAMKDSATNTSPPAPVNGTPNSNVSTIAQSTITVKSKPAIKSTTTVSKNLQFHCEWHECKKIFNRPSQVYWHVHKEHVNIYGNTTEKMTCKWGGPEGRGPGCLASRPKLSLLTHINDFHCNANALQQSALRRESGVNVPPPIVPPAHPGYSSNAALLAIRRHAINYVEPLKPPPITPLTPITTSIRLTAALILRNLAQVSSKLRLFLQSLEPYLSELCIVEGREESRTIAQCLGVITERNERKRIE